MNQYRKPGRIVRGFSTVDGAGVHLTRVLGHDTVYDFDPFLMLDSFDSGNPADYLKGFPMHPHRGIETITYLIEGAIAHQDSLGNAGTIVSGASQWMTAGSGILHQEMPQPKERLLGFQLWLNLPASEKMTQPKYFEIKPEDVRVVNEPGAEVRIISGDYAGVSGVEPYHIQATLLDVSLEPDRSVEIPVAEHETAFIFTLQGDAIVAGETFAEKTAILMESGKTIKVSATEGKSLRFALASAPALHEGIAWGGPIVMNTKAELQQAFDDLRSGKFIKHQPNI